jgi:putative nucleotidyltransferase with HDIG domain
MTSSSERDTRVNPPKATADLRLQRAGESSATAHLKEIAWQIIDRTPEVRPEKVVFLSEAVLTGAYQVDSRQRRSGFSGRNDLDLVNLLARYPTLVYEYLALHGGNPSQRPETIKDILWALQARDNFTGTHSLRVTVISLRFARYLGVPAAELDHLETAGYLHDFGKVLISDAILRKAGQLSLEERSLIETHPLVGQEILAPFGLTPQEKEIIIHHHERWDGRGYPQGLAGEDIPFFCRLFSLADVYDALTSERPYRHRFTIPEALAEIGVNASSQFDPDLAWKFVEMISAEHLPTLHPETD